MPRVQNIEAVDLIYETIEDPNRWPIALDAIAESMSAKGALLMVLLPNRTRIAIASPRIKLASIDYMKNWSKEDIRTNRIDERKLLISKDIVVDSDVVSEIEMDQHQFYNKFLASHDLRYFCASVWSPASNISIGLSIQRSRAEGEFSLEEQGRAAHLGRHVERAVRIRGKFTQERMYSESLEVLTYHSEHAVMLVSSSGEVKFSNITASKMPSTIASVVSGQLRIAAAAQRDRIFAAIKKACCSIPEASSQPIFIPGGGGIARLCSECDSASHKYACELRAHNGQ
jgi:hypothetical protein